MCSNTTSPHYQNSSGEILNNRQTIVHCPQSCDIKYAMVHTVYDDYVLLIAGQHEVPKDQEIWEASPFVCFQNDRNPEPELKVMLPKYAFFLCCL
mgnify:CR=1 FL=1